MIGPIELRLVLDDIDKMDLTELLRTKSQLEFRLNQARAKFKEALKQTESEVEDI